MRGLGRSKWKMEKEWLRVPEVTPEGSQELGPW